MFNPKSLGFVFYLIGYLLLTLISHETTHIHICGNLSKPNNSTSKNNSSNGDHCRFPVFLVLIIM